ncbi:hypothetical protein FJT64_025595 [Amphibalanus amphitrite]|uniref:Uncharacterized protein n=1 Tax=Amphibalanus amphitrite TaxID=1232801 RepID=A0A6A4W4Q5_AMPAM|nr:hypothetical protein FJT64_025595 [Amphibalanus amphitrite]
MAKGRERLHSAINQVMRVLNQAGTISRLKARWLTGGQDMCTASGGFKELSLGDVLAVLVLVPLGIICSVGLFMLEWLWVKCSPCQRKSQALQQYPFEQKAGSKTSWGI